MTRKKRANRKTRRLIQPQKDHLVQSSPALYEQIVSELSDGIALLDRNYVYQAVNPAYCDRFKKPPSEIIGQSSAALFGELFFETKIKPLFDRALAGETVHHEDWLDHPQLGRYFIRVIHTPYVEPNGTITGVMVFTRNLTQLKTAEIELCAREVELQRLNGELEQRVQQRTAELQNQAKAAQLLAAIAQTINQSVRLDDVLELCWRESGGGGTVCRVIVCRFDPAYDVVIELEAVSCPELSLVGRTINDPCLSRDWIEQYRQGCVTIRSDTHVEPIIPCYAEFLVQMQIRASLVVGILQADQLWGLLIAHRCTEPRQWQSVEVDLIQQLATQFGIAIQKAALYTQLETQLAQKEILLKEVHHRVKNNLQVVSSMLSLQANVTQHPAVFKALKETRSRLQAMALIHETLYQSKDLGQLNFHHYIRRLATSILVTHSVRPNQIAITYRLQPVIFNLETAIPCGLLLNELLTNAVKHGFPDRQDGEVCITLELLALPERDSEPEFPSTRSLSTGSKKSSPCYILTVQDNGVGVPADLDLNNLTSLGLKIAFDLALQLQGVLELERVDGTRFRLTFSMLEYRKRF